MARWATLPRPDSFPAIRVALRTGRVADRAANRHSGCPPGNGRADAEHQPGSDPPSELGSFCWRSSRHSRVDAAGITAAGGTGLTQKVREGGRIVNVCVVVATGVNAEGQREILGMDVGATEDGAFWLAVLRSLTARGLSGVELVTSDAHQGLKSAIAAVFAGASWQRCRTHFMANLLTRVPKRAQPGVATQDLLAWCAPSTSNCLPPRSTANWTEWWNNSGSPLPRWPNCWRTPRRTSWLHGLPSGPLAEAVVQQPAGTAEPGDKAPESLPPKGDVVGIFPNRLSARRMVGAVLAEQHDEWAEARRYLTIPNAAGNEAPPAPNMLDAAA